MIRRVLMTADTVGGVWNYSLDLSRELGRRGIEVALATMGRLLSPDQAREAAAIPRLQVHESDYRLEWMEDPWSDLRRAGDWLLDLERTVRPDVVHLNGYVHASLPWSVPTLVVCHSCVLSWWQAVKGETAPCEWNRYRDEVRRGLQDAGLVLAPSRAMLAEAERIYGPFRKVDVIPNARDTRAFAPVPKEPFVFSAGRFWDEAKNVAALDGIAGDLSWPVYVAGEEHGASDSKVNRLGHRPSVEVAAWLARASIYALPARYEPFGLSILEAALSGCALVLGDIPSLRENWEGCAFFVDPNDSQALKMAIEGLIANEDLRRRLGETARVCGERFGLEPFAQSYLDAYGALLETSPRELCLA